MFNLTTTLNAGLLKRAHLMAESRVVKLHSKVDVDVFKTDKTLMNGVSIYLTLVTTTAAFRLLTPNMSYTDYVMEVVKIFLELKMISPSNHVLIAHQKVMQSNFE